MAAVIAHISTGCIYQAGFADFRRASGLTHTNRKCVVVPLAAPAKLPYLAAFKEAVERHCPGWCCYAIAGHHKIAGYEVGPGALAQAWAGPLAKTKMRLNFLNASKCAPSLACTSFAAKVLPVPGHVAQLSVPPRGVYDLERLAVNKLYHAPPADLPVEVGLYAPRFGAVKVPTLGSFCLASLWRAAVTLEVDAAFAVLARDGEELGILRARDGLWWDPHWSAPAFSAVLLSVRDGTGDKVLPNAEKTLFSTLRREWAAARPAAKRRAQAWATNALDHARFPRDIAEILAARCARHFCAATAE